MMLLRHRQWRIDIDALTFAVLWLFIFAVPWESEVVLPVDFPLSHAIGLAVAVSGVSAALIKGRIRRVSTLHYVAAALVVWAGMSYAWSLAPDLTEVRVASYVQLLFLLWLIWEYASDPVRQRRLLAAYVLGTWIAALSTIYAFMAGIESTTGTASGRYTAAGENENELGIILAIGIPIASHLICGSRRWQALWFVSAPVFFLAIMLTGSRGSFLAATVGLLLFALSARQLRPRLKLAGAVALMALTTTAIVWLPESVWARVESIPAELSQGTLTKRTYIWSAGLDAYRDHVVTGVGAGAFEAGVYGSLDIAYVAHNSYLSVLVELGAVGMMLFGTLLVGLSYSALKLPSQQRRLWIVLLLTWGLSVSSVTWEHRKPTWFLFGMLIAQSAAFGSPRLRKAEAVAPPFAQNLRIA